MSSNLMFPFLAPFRRAGCLACIVFWAAFTPKFAVAAAPSNDTCAGAIVVPAVPYLSPIIDVFSATTNGDPVVPTDCVGDGNSNLTRSVWFRFTPSATGLYTFSTGPDTATDFGESPPSNDSVMAIYTAPNACAGPFTLVSCNDDAQGVKLPNASGISRSLTAGVTYYIVVWVGQQSAAAITTGPVNLQLRITKPAVPANNDCAGAETISGTGPFPYFTAITDDTLATDAANELISACAGFRAVWYKFTPATNATYIFSTDTDTATTVGDTTIAIFSGSCAAPAEVVCNDPNFRRAIITNAMTAGVTRYILVWDAEPDPIPGETSVQLRVSVAGPPTVTTLAASNITSITSTSAVVNMSIAPNGFSTRYFFEWGTTTSYGNMTPSKPIGTPLLQGKSETLANFTPGVTYHYRAVGSNSQGKVFGIDRTFVASTNRPTLTGPAWLAGGRFQFQFSGNVGQLYAIQASSNFVNWVELGNATDLGTGVFQFIHTPGSSPPYRFYKARVR